MWLAEVTASAEALGYGYVGCSQAGKDRAKGEKREGERNELREALGRGPCVQLGPGRAE